MYIKYIYIGLCVHQTQPLFLLGIWYVDTYLANSKLFSLKMRLWLFFLFFIFKNYKFIESIIVWKVFLLLLELFSLWSCCFCYYLSYFLSEIVVFGFLLKLLLNNTSPNQNLTCSVYIYIYNLFYFFTWKVFQF